MERRSQLLGVFYAEFHVDLGPILVHQYPQDSITQDDFNAVKKYLITKPDIANRFVSISLKDRVFAGFPVDIAGSQYHRNHLLFNMGLLLTADADIAVFEPVIRKLARYLRSFETDLSFISSPESKARLAGIVQAVFTGLHRNGACDIPVDDGNSIRLMLLGSAPRLPVVESFMVPVLLHQDPQIIMEAQRLDATAHRLLPYVDGISTVKRIARLADVDLGMATQLFGALVYCHLIALVEPFQFCSVFVVTDKIRDLYADERLQQECLSFIAIPGAETCSIQQVFALYCELKPQNPHMNMAHFVDKHSPAKRGINVRRFIQYGLIKRFIRQLRKYPVRDRSAPFDPDSDIMLSSVTKYLDGQNSTDKICCELEISAKRLDDILDSDPYTFTFRR